MPLEEPSGSSIPSAPEEEEETVASKQTHILEQVKKEWAGTSLAIQWLRLCVSTAGGTGSIPGRGTKIPPQKKSGQSLE